MQSKQKLKIDPIITILIIIFGVISIFTIKSASELVVHSTKYNYALRQGIWYLVGIIGAIIVARIKKEHIYRSIKYLYVIGIISLILLLIFGTPINNSKCWFKIPYIGIVQPSEFMKIILILTLSMLINNFHEKHSIPSMKDEFVLILKTLIIVGIPSVLTFLQPDTGVVLIYLLITFVMLFISGIRYRWFIVVLIVIGLVLGTILGLYFFNTELFIKIFGTSFFLRVDRLLDWSNKSGYQLENGMSAIGAAGLSGFGLNHTPIYFPEPQTDFIFAVYASNFGFIGSVVLLSLLFFFDLRLILIALKTKDKMNKHLISGCIAMLLYQQVQNIGMTYGLLPITGITLPFISYGGSSLLSYLLMIGLIFNLSRENKDTYTI